MHKESKEKINKETEALNYTLYEIGLTDIYRAFHPKVAEYTFSNAHGIFSRLDYMLGHKVSLGKYKKIEIISSMFSDYNAMRLEINNKENCKKKTNKNPQTLGC